MIFAPPQFQYSSVSILRSLSDCWLCVFSEMTTAASPPPDVPCALVVPHLYGRLFGVNADARWLCFILGLDPTSTASVGRFRDAYLCAGGTEIVLYTRNGDGSHMSGFSTDDHLDAGGQCYSCPGCVFRFQLLKHNSYLRHSNDGDYSSIFFSVPTAWTRTCKEAFEVEPETIDAKFEQHLQWTMRHPHIVDSRVDVIKKSVHALDALHGPRAVFDADRFPSTTGLRPMATVFDQQCPVCFRPDSKHRCSGCRYVWYCSADCQRFHWSQVHQRTCKSMVTCKKIADTRPLVIEQLPRIFGAVLNACSRLGRDLCAIIACGYLGVVPSLSLAKQPSWASSDGSFPHQVCCLTASPANFGGVPVHGLVHLASFGCRWHSSIPGTVERLVLSARAYMQVSTLAIDSFASAGKDPLMLHSPSRYHAFARSSKGDDLLEAAKNGCCPLDVGRSALIAENDAPQRYTSELLILTLDTSGNLCRVASASKLDLSDPTWEYDDLSRMIPEPLRRHPCVSTDGNVVTHFVAPVVDRKTAPSSAIPLEIVPPQLSSLTAEESKLWKASFLPRCKLVVIGHANRVIEMIRARWSQEWQNVPAHPAWNRTVDDINDTANFGMGSVGSAYFHDFVLGKWMEDRPRCRAFVIQRNISGQGWKSYPSTSVSLDSPFSRLLHSHLRVIVRRDYGVDDLPTDLPTLSIHTLDIPN